VNRYVGNLPPMPGVFPDYPAPVVRNAGSERELTMMRWGMPPPPKFGGAPVLRRPSSTTGNLRCRIERGLQRRAYDEGVSQAPSLRSRGAHLTAPPVTRSTVPHAKLASNAADPGPPGRAPRDRGRVRERLSRHKRPYTLHRTALLWSNRSEV